MDNRLKYKIKLELENNRLWRVKELLSSAIKSYDYDEELYLEYAKTLFKLGDYMDSGKYFLLTNTNKKEYLEAIDLFLSRYNDNFFDYLPRNFKKLDPENYPNNIIKILDNKKLKDKIYKQYKNYQNINNNNKDLTKLEEFTGYAFIIFTLVLIILGFIKLVELILSLFN